MYHLKQIYSDEFILTWMIHRKNLHMLPSFVSYTFLLFCDLTCDEKFKGFFFSRNDLFIFDRDCHLSILSNEYYG